VAANGFVVEPVAMEQNGKKLLLTANTPYTDDIGTIVAKAVPSAKVVTGTYILVVI
jgi:hypothetical protein